MPDKRVLLVGGAGYIGSELARQLAETDATFLLLDSFIGASLSEVDCKRLDWSYTKADIRDVRQVEKAIAQFVPTHIIHLAAIHYIPYCTAHPTETMEVNVGGLLNVVTACTQLASRPEFIFVSSAAVYKGAPGPSVETDSLAPDDVYGSSKFIGEHIVRHTFTKYRIARLFNVFGMHDPHDHVIPKIYKKAVVERQSLELGSPISKRDYVHVSDVANALVSLLDYEGSETTFNIGTGIAFSVAEVVEAFQKAFEGMPPVSYFHSKNLRASDKPELQADISRIKSELRWRPQYNLLGGLETLR